MIYPLTYGRINNPICFPGLNLCPNPIFPCLTIFVSTQFLWADDLCPSCSASCHQPAFLLQAEGGACGLCEGGMHASYPGKCAACCVRRQICHMLCSMSGFVQWVVLLCTPERACDLFGLLAARDGHQQIRVRGEDMMMLSMRYIHRSVPACEAFLIYLSAWLPSTCTFIRPHCISAPPPPAGGRLQRAARIIAASCWHAPACMRVCLCPPGGRKRARERERARAVGIVPLHWFPCQSSVLRQQWQHQYTVWVYDLWPHATQYGFTVKN